MPPTDAVHKKFAKLITGLRIAEMSQLQNCSVMCTKNGSYCENEKKREKVRGEGGCVQRMEVIVKRKKVRGGGQGRCDRRSEAFVIFFFWGGGRVGGGGGQVGCEWRSEAFVKIKKKNGGGGVGAWVRGGMGSGWGGGGGQGRWEQK